MEYIHKSVLLKEAVDSLNIVNGGVYVDATLGGGGHFIEIVNRLNELGEGTVIGIDADKDSIEFVGKNIEKYATKNVRKLLVNENFAHLKEILKKEEIEEINGIIFDLGLSSYQIDNPDKGFSYMHEGPLDMRMNQDLNTTASDLINGLYENELEQLFRDYGEERFARSIAKGIVKERKVALIKTTNELVKVIERNVPRNYEGGRSHKSKRVFQALRIAVNSELDNLLQSLPQAFEVLALDGIISVITFHSLEDRIVKNFIRSKVNEGKAEFNIDRFSKPTLKEINENPRSKSAKIRSLIKLSN